MKDCTALLSRKSTTLICSFLLPCLLMLSILAATGIYPFGEKSLLIIDMNNEYVDYLAQMNTSLRTGGSFLRSWHMGMGLNMLGLIAFYTASPFNLLVMAFPVTWITEALFAVTVLKIGLAGLNFSLYTAYTLDRRGLFAVVFSTAYALCGYNIAYASNIMWLDGAAFLPLVLLGVEQLLRENRPTCFLFSLVYVFFTSYYIGYMIGGFAFLYLTCVWFSRSSSVKQYLVKLGSFLLAAALAAGCCAFLLLPAFYSLKNGQSEMWNIGIRLGLDKPLVRIASRLLPGVYDTLTDSGYPNIYCTGLVLLLVLCFFTHRGVSRREKLVFGGLLAFLLLSFSCDFLDLAWHAFEDPTWFPARYSFVFSFLLIYLAMRCAVELDSLSGAGMAGAGALFLLLLVEAGIGRYRHIHLKTLLFSALLAGAYMLIWLMAKRRKRHPTASRRCLAFALLVLVSTEAWLNGWVIERGLDREFSYKTRDSYMQYRSTYAPAVDALAQIDPAVYRLEVLEQRNANGGMALGYNGISHYSTTTDQSLNAFLRQLGYNRGTENELRFAPNTPLTNGLLGIKYILSQQSPGLSYDLLDEVNDVGIYQNPYAFPLAFWAGEDALTSYGDEGDDPFALQNTILSSLGSDAVPFSPIYHVTENLVNAERKDMGEYIQYTPRVTAEKGCVEFSLSNPGESEAFAFFPVWNRKFSPAQIYVDGVFAQQDLRYRKNTIVALGDGDTVTVTLKFEQPVRIAANLFYAFDQGQAAEAVTHSRRYAADFSLFQDTAVQCSILAPDDGVLLTTFPLDRGWRVYVDGKETLPQSFAGVFLALPVTSGAHQVSMRYLPPGFAVGCGISVTSLLLTLLYCHGKKAKKS